MGHLTNDSFLLVKGIAMKVSSARILSASLIQSVYATDLLPEGAIQADSRANETLIHDAMIGVAAKIAGQGCSSPEHFTPYIMVMPVGDAGARH
ncbi:hypothetical protein [Amphritea pacifica]|uniref:Uncharacterized protein n=1 Tax=Amphritea pacifica TaxID=2811233 RepID=A0ABS2W658_9GAMM|nr:hypothetical protein [Amphritea pacifica]MBN0987197.1 hypothetical protein [Amphritea pacifica]